MTSSVSAIPDAPVSLVNLKHERLAMLDCARFIAALGVVWVHTFESPQLASLGVLGTFGVPFYICVALFMTKQTLARNPSLPLPLYYFQRAVRLYVPFLFWTAVYLFAIYIKRTYISHLPMHPLGVSVLLGGSAYQLWFLPFLLLITIPTAFLYRITLEYPKSASKVVLVVAALGTIWAFWPRPDWLNYLPESQGFFLVAWKAGPSVFCGFAMAHFLSRMPREELTLSGLAGIGFFLTIAALGNQVVFGYSRFDRTLSGLGWFLMTFAPLRGKLIVILGSLGRHSYGIFLSHALFVEGWQIVLHKIGFHVSPAMDVSVLVLAVTCSTLATMIASRWAIPALLFGGPPRKAARREKPVDAPGAASSLMPVA